MSLKLQIKRGTAAEIANYTGAAGELVFATDTKQLFCMDGVAKGGYLMSDFRTEDVSCYTPQFLEADTASGRTYIKVHAGTHIRISNGGSPVYYSANQDVSFDVKSILDTGNSLANAKDYYIYAVTDGANNQRLVCSLNSTYPAGYTAETSRKIGGFHTLCVSVGTGLTYYRNGAQLNHALNGYEAGDILPASVWCLKHRPYCSPEGMVYEPETNMWVDIYLQSGTGTSTASIYGATVTDTRYPQAHMNDMLRVHKRLLDEETFTAAAQGSNEQTAISGAKDWGTTGGHVDTNNRRMISNIGCEDMCGFMWQWFEGSAQGPVGGSGWANYGTYKNDNWGGSSYGTPYWLLGGGNWNDGSSCGPLSRSANDGRGSLIVYNGGRGASPNIH